MSDILDQLGMSPLGRPTDAQPAGRARSRATSAPIAAKVGVPIPLRTPGGPESFQLEAPDPDDSPDGSVTFTDRHRRPF